MSEGIVKNYKNISLPSAWRWVKIGEIARQINSGFPSGQHNREGIGVPHLRPMNISSKGEIDLSDLKYVQETNYDCLLEGDVLFNNTNSPALLGKTAYVKRDSEWAYSNHMTRIRLWKEIAEPAWVSYSLHYLFYTGFFRINCRNHVNQASINTSFLTNEVEIPLPPINEQKDIVFKIEALFSQLDAATTALKRVQTNLKRYKASVLKAACEGRLVPTEAELARKEGRSYESGAELLERILKERRRRWEEEQRAKGKDPAKMKYPEPARPDTEGLPDLPEGWVWASLTQIGYFGRGKSKHRPRNDPDLFEGPYPFIQTGEIRHADGYITSFTNTYNEKGLQQSKLWPNGTLCITIAANIAETAILSFEACFPDSVVGFIPEIPLDVRFIDFFFRTAKENLERNAPATAQKNINLEILNNLAIPIPPIEEQRRIITDIEEKLSVVTHIDRIVNTNRNRNTLLHQSILEQAFTGMLCSENGAVSDLPPFFVPVFMW